MTGMSMNHQQARRLVRRTQIGGLIVAAAAAGLWALDVPGLDAGDQPPQVASESNGSGNTLPDRVHKPHPTTGAIDPGASASIAQLLDTAARRPPKQNLEPIAQATPENPGGPAVKFLGVIENGASLVALMSIDGHQRLLGTGKTSGEVRVLEVNRESIRVMVGREERTISLSERTGPSVAWINPAVGGAGGGMNGVAGVANGAIPTPNAGVVPGLAGRGGPGGNGDAMAAAAAANAASLQRQRDQEARRSGGRARGASTAPPGTSPDGVVVTGSASNAAETVGGANGNHDD